MDQNNTVAKLKRTTVIECFWRIWMINFKDKDTQSESNLKICFHIFSDSIHFGQNEMLWIQFKT